MTAHQVFMKKALSLAQKAQGRTSPNPQVGAVVVQDGVIVGQGYHGGAGTPHAEVLALQEAGPLAQGATLYVNLEPCCHHGRTPPCTHRILEQGIRQVVVALEDPNPQVKGRGIGILREAGVQVEIGIMEEEARRLNRIFIKYMETQRPYVHLKGAMTLDGKIASRTHDARWITGEKAREWVHRLRDEVDAVLVGRGTVVFDDPLLTTRLPGGGGQDGVRVILDTHLQLTPDYRIFQEKGGGPVLLAAVKGDPEKVRLWQEQGVEVMFLQEQGGRVDLEDLLWNLGRREITSLLVEGGSEVNASFLEQGLVDTLILFIAPRILCGRGAVPFTGGTGWATVEESLWVEDYQLQRMGSDLMLTADLQRRGGTCLPV